MSNDNNFNLNSLCWVKHEIDASLAVARENIERYAAESGELQSLDIALQQITDALGTLEIAEIEGGAMLAREIRDLLSVMKTGREGAHLKGPDVLGPPIVRAMIQLSDYLDYIEAGNPDVPVVLVNAINDLRILRHADPVSEGIADIPGLQRDAATLAQQQATSERIRDMAGLARQVFELGLVGWYRKKDVDASLNRMAIVCRRLKNASRNVESRRLWWVSEAVMSGLRHRVLPHSYSLKFLVGKIDRQIKRLQKVGEDAYAAEVPLPLVRSLLYYIVSAPPGDSLVDSVRKTYFPDDEGEMGEMLAAARDSVEGDNSALYRTLSDALREKLTTIKDELELHVHAGDADQHLRNVSEMLAELAGTLEMLGVRHQAAFVLQNSRRLQGVVGTGATADDKMLNDLAEMLLGVESAVQSFSLVGRHFAAAGRTSREQGEASTKAAVREQEFREIRASVIRESLQKLEQVKESFQEYAVNPNILAVLANVPDTLGEVSGAMRMASEEQVAEILNEAAEFVRVRELAGKIIEFPELEQIAEAISSVDVYLEILDASGLKQTHYLEKGLQAALGLQPEAEVEDADPTRMSEGDALLDDPTRLFNPETLVVEFSSSTEQTDTLTAMPSAPEAPAVLSGDDELEAEDGVAEPVGDDSQLFDAQTLTMAGIAAETSLHVDDIRALDDDTVFQPSEKEMHASEDVYSETGVFEEAVAGAGADDESDTLASIVADWPEHEAAASPELDVDRLETEDKGRPGIDGSMRADTVAEIDLTELDLDGSSVRSLEVDEVSSSSETFEDHEERTQVVSKEALHLEEIGQPEEGDAEGTAPVSDLDFEETSQIAFEEVAPEIATEDSGLANEVEELAPPTLTISGIEVEELAGFEEEALPADDAVVSEADAMVEGTVRADELDTLEGMEFDRDGMDTAYERALDVFKDEPSVEMESLSGMASDIETATAFLFPDDSAANLVSGDEQTPSLVSTAGDSAEIREDVAPLEELAEGDLPDETGVKRLDLDGREDSLANANDEEQETGFFEEKVLTLVDVLPDDELPEFDVPEPENELEISASGGDSGDGSAVADETTQGQSLPAAYHGLEVLRAGADDEIIDIFNEEFVEETAVLQSHFPQWKAQPDSHTVLVTLRRSFHTLKGSARLVGADIIGEFAWQHENLLNQVLDKGREITPDIIETIGEGIALLPRLQQQLGSRTAPDEEIITHACRIDALLAGEPQERPEEEAPQTLMSAMQDPELMRIFSEEAHTNLDNFDALLGDLVEGRDRLEVADELKRLVHTFNGSARTAKVASVYQPSAALEHYLSRVFGVEGDPAQLDLELLKDFHAHVESVLQALAEETSLPPASDLVARIDEMAARIDLVELPEPVDMAPSPAAEERVDLGEADEHAAISRELIEIFLDESEEILENCDATMQRWQQSADDLQLVRELNRSLHTLKGSARMAGLEPIGDLAHAAETLLIEVAVGSVGVDKTLFTVIFGVLDRFDEMNEQVRAGKSLEPVDEMLELLARIQQGGHLSDADIALLRPRSSTEVEDEEVEQSQAVAEERVVEPGLPFESRLAELMPRGEGVGAAGEMLVSRLQDSVKVSPESLDQFVDSVGEINILNSRVEQQVGAFGFNLQELERTISRLTEQLRKLEMEAEAQILHRFDGHKVNPDETGINEYFDPLELDRYSNIQQLSRSLAESTNDLMSIHHLLSEERRDVENLLQQEARISSSLQEALMRTRMSPFKVMVPRLRRVVRGVALDLQKEAELVIEGEEQELDRKVLEGIVVPLEHLLRNALAHGIEMPEQRLAAGKPEHGTISITVSREGPEVVIVVSDDGAGIDRRAVRERAIEQGLIAAEDELTDAEIDALILRHGFSTATEIDQVSGRGVGMDVVQEQLRHLNGLLEIASEQGRGTRFRISLPFTLAINQSLLTRVGSEVYAIPINTIDGVIQLQDTVLAEKLAEGSPMIEYGDRSYRLVRLDEVLENRTLEPLVITEQPRSVLLVGAGEQSVALIVDEIEGNQDVVVKPIGGLLNSVPGLGGATVLGNGRVVLILDTAGVVRAASGGRVAEEVAPAALVSASDIRPTIMVVDDSITIRRVTEKMLERHHFRVITAKDGLDAVAQLEATKPDVMLLDIEMPRMDGFELAAHVQASEELKGLPIIMISSRTGKKHRERAVSLGVREFLGKPYQDGELLEHIEAALQERKQREACDVEG